MSLQDRDYMHDRPGREGRPFTPASTGWESWLIPAITMALIGILVFSVVQRLLPVLRAAKPAITAQPASPPTKAAEAPTRHPPIDPFPDDPQWSTARRAPVAPAAPEQRTAYRCIINGVTTWSDQPNCPQAATVVLGDPHPVPAHAPHPPQPAPVFRSPLPAPVSIQAPPPQHNDKAYRCAAISDDIKRIDVLARQPLAASTQDELSQRKRDLQKEGFFLHCYL